MAITANIMLIMGMAVAIRDAPHQTYPIESNLMILMSQITNKNVWKAMISAAVFHHCLIGAADKHDDQFQVF